MRGGVNSIKPKGRKRGKYGVSLAPLNSQEKVLGQPSPRGSPPVSAMLGWRHCLQNLAYLLPLEPNPLWMKLPPPMKTSDDSWLLPLSHLCLAWGCFQRHSRRATEIPEADQKRLGKICAPTATSHMESWSSHRSSSVQSQNILRGKPSSSQLNREGVGPRGNAELQAHPGSTSPTSPDAEIGSRRLLQGHPPANHPTASMVPAEGLLMLSLGPCLHIWPFKNQGQLVHVY